LVLWKALDIPPLAARQSLLSAFLDYCNVWTPVLEQKDIHELSCFDPEKTSMLLAQSLWLAGSRVTNAPSVVAFASSDDFYHRAKAVFWSGVETDGLSAIKASLMLQWYNPQAPEHISFDNSGFWLKIGVGIAHQIGLHKESSPGPSRAIRRRLWWSLVVSRSLDPFLTNLATCWVAVRSAFPCVSQFILTENYTGSRLLDLRRAWKTANHQSGR
jgi:hypothetical protein